MNKNRGTGEKITTFDDHGFIDLLSADARAAIEAEASDAARMLIGGSGEGGEYTGWLDLPVFYDREEVKRIKAAAERVRSDSEVFIVIGIGGSYLGARAAIEFLKLPFYNNLDSERRGAPEIYFAGNNISGAYLSRLIDIIGDRDFSVNVISKSGTTTEPAIAFRVFKNILEKRCGKDGAAKRIYVTTDRSRGALKSLADSEGYEKFAVPDDIGGRFSVLTAVGLLPIAVSGADIDALLAGAADERENALTSPFDKNAAMRYASVRNLLYRRGKAVEVLSCGEPHLHYVAEWWKQLFGESEGKDLKGIFPASIDLTADLHSMGQFLQDGSRVMFETFLDIDAPPCHLSIERDLDDIDGLSYIAGKSIDFINNRALRGAAQAHADGGVPVLGVRASGTDERSLGQLFYFFEFACGVSAYMLGVNPFDQPGVERYKTNMFRLLGKPGY